MGKKNSGLTLMTAIFILLITALTAQFLINASRISLSGINILLTGTRALLAAKSGTEWGLTNAVLNGSCPPPTNINLTQTGLKGFSVLVSCSSRDPDQYTVTATASYGTFSEFGYATRTFTASRP